MRRTDDDEALPVMVPRNDRALVEMAADRMQRLRSHLLSLLGGPMSEAADTAPRPEPAGFAARVARTACTLCRGWCCRNGADDAFLDAPTVARAGLGMSGADAVIQHYLSRVPVVSYQNSCIFHAENGCTLDRPMRSDVCNAYFCGGLQAYVRGDDMESPVVVIAGERNKMRRSAVLLPDGAVR